MFRYCQMPIPFWEKNTLLDLANKFTSMTIEEVDSFLSKDYKKSILLFDRILTHTSTMGDYLAQGITKYLIFSSRQPQMP